MRNMVKAGLMLIKDGSFLVTRKRKTSAFLIPGGRYKRNENDFQCLEREIKEELNCLVDLSSLQYLDIFTDVAANEPNSSITVRLYLGEIIGTPSPSSEIAEIKWFNPKVDDISILAPSIQNKILPYLLEHNLLTIG
jgi:8-oxo-dGTP diphosphatase